MKNLRKLMLLLTMVVSGANLFGHPGDDHPGSHGGGHATDYESSWGDDRQIVLDDQSTGHQIEGLYSACTGTSGSEQGTCPGKLYCVTTPKNKPYQKTKPGDKGSCRSARGR